MTFTNNRLARFLEAATARALLGPGIAADAMREERGIPFFEIPRCPWDGSPPEGGYNPAETVPVHDKLRDALDRATRGMRLQLERDLADYTEALKRESADERARAAQEAAEAAAAGVRRQADAQIAELQQAAVKQAEDLKRAAAEDRDRAVRESVEAAERRIEEIQRAATGERERAKQQAAETTVAGVRRQAETQIAQLRDAAHRRAEEIKRTAEAHVSELRSTLQAQLEEVRRAAQAQTEEERRRARAEVDKAKAEVEAVRYDAEKARRAAQVEAERVLKEQLAAARAEAAKQIEEAVGRTRTDAGQPDLAQTVDLVDAVRALDEAQSLGDLLDALAECAGRKVERAAVLVVRGDHLRGWRLSGFAYEGSARSIDLDLDAAGLAGTVVRTGVSVSRPIVEPRHEKGSRQPALPGFAQDAGARHALALPIIVVGHVVAVLYADAPRLENRSAASRWPAVLEVLARHASRALEAITVQQATGLSLPRPVPRAPHGVVPGSIEHAGTGDTAASLVKR